MSHLKHECWKYFNFKHSKWLTDWGQSEVKRVSGAAYTTELSRSPILNADICKLI